MTKEQKIEAYSMRLDGIPIREIADKFGVSFQYIQQLFPAARRCSKARFSRYIYPNISKYLVENDMTLYALAAECDTSVTYLQTFFSGKSGCSKRVIDAILKATGMKYEEAFFTGPAEGPDGQTPGRS